MRGCGAGRAARSTDWAEFEGRSSTRKILGGFGNLEDNRLYLPDGDVRAVALRSHAPQTQARAIRWLDGRAPHHLHTPVIGGFSDGVGRFASARSRRHAPGRRHAGRAADQGTLADGSSMACVEMDKALGARDENAPLPQVD